MMEFSFADKDVLEYAKGQETLASGADDAAKKKFADAQRKVEHIIMSSLSMELGEQVMNKGEMQAELGRAATRQQHVPVEGSARRAERGRA
jgi:hypothetical protein